MARFFVSSKYDKRNGGTMKRKVVLRCLSCLLTGMLLLETPLQVFAEQTNDVVQNDAENENQDAEPAKTDESVEETEGSNPTENEEQKDVSKTEESQDKTKEDGPNQEMPPSEGEIPPTNDENIVTEDNKISTEDGSDEIKPEDEENKNPNTQPNTPEAPVKDDKNSQDSDAVIPPENKTSSGENTPVEELLPEEPETSELPKEQTEAEDEMDDFFILTGEQYGTEAIYLTEKKELLEDYQEAADVLQGALSEKKSELSLKEMSLSPEIVQDLLVYIVNDTDVDCSYLLPLVTYTYVEKADEADATYKNVYSICFSYLSKESQLTLNQESRSLKDGVKLTFTTDASVETYRLYRYDTDWEEWTQVAELSAKDAKSFTDTDVADSGTYLYRLMGYQMVEDKEVLCNFSPSIESKYTLDTPENPKAQSMSASVELTWDEVSDATAYEVEVYDEAKGDFTYLETVTENHYLHEELESGKVYQYRIRAIYQSMARLASAATVSSYSDTVKGQTAPAATKKVSYTSEASDSVLLQWEAVQGADGYCIYQDGNEVQKTSELSYQIGNLKAGIEYKFEVRAYADNGSKVLMGDASAVYAMPLLPAVNLTVERAAYNQLKLTWQEAAPKVSYEIYRKTEGEAEQLIQTITDENTLTWTDSTVKFDTTYQYRIRAVKKVQDRSYTGAYSKEVSGVTTLDAVTIQAVSTSDMQSLQISWNQAPGATGYEVYRSATSGSGYEKIANLPADTTTYRDNGLNIASTYYYQVRAYATEGAKTVYSNYSPEVSGTVKLSDVANLQVTMTKVNTLHLTWDASSDAKTYEVYYYSSIDPRVKRLTNTRKTYYDFKKAKCGVTYYFKVRTCQTISKVKHYGDYSQEISGMTVINGVPTISIKKVTFNSISLKWTKVKDAKKYEIWYATSPDGEYQLLKTLGGASFTHKKLTTGDTYYYKIRPVRDYYTGEFSEVISSRPGLDELKGLKIERGTKQLKLSWKKLKGTENYVILRSEQENGTYKEIVRTSKNTFTDTGLKDNTKYYYKVYAVAGSCESNILGPLGETTYEEVTVTEPSKPSSDHKKMYYGVDVSSYQGKIDWDDVADDDIDFAMIRILTGKGTSNLSIDSRFEYNYKNARAAGIKVGVYRYSYATTKSGARREVEQILDALDGRKLDYPIVLDMEDSSVLNGTSREKRTEIILEYKKRVEEAGYKFALYANKDWLENHIQPEALDGVDIWLARWRSLSSGPGYNGAGNLTMWQYSSKGSVDGISGAVDLDVSYKRY